jgi:hypothetical protein
MPILAIIGFFGSFVKKWAAAAVRFGTMLAISTFILGFTITFYVGLMSLVFIALSKVNALVNYINSYAGNTDELIALFFNVLKSLGVIEAFKDVYTIFKPFLFTAISLIALKIFIKGLESFRKTLLYLFISRID